MWWWLWSWDPSSISNDQAWLSHRTRHWWYQRWYEDHRASFSSSTTSLWASEKFLSKAPDTGTSQDRPLGSTLAAHTGSRQSTRLKIYMTPITMFEQGNERARWMMMWWRYLTFLFVISCICGAVARAENSVPWITSGDAGVISQARYHTISTIHRPHMISISTTIFMQNKC